MTPMTDPLPEDAQALRERVALLEADRDSHRAAAEELRAVVDAALRAVPLQFWVAAQVESGVSLATKAAALAPSVARLAEAATTYRQAAAELQAHCDALTADVTRLNNRVLELQGV